MEDDMNDSGEAPRSYEDLPEVESPWAEIIDLGTSMARAWIMMLAPDAYTRFGDQFLDTLRGTGEWLKLADARRARMRDPLTRLPWGEQVDLARCNNIQIDHLTLTRGWEDEAQVIDTGWSVQLFNVQHNIRIAASRPLMKTHEAAEDLADTIAIVRAHGLQTGRFPTEISWDDVRYFQESKKAIDDTST